MVILPSWCQAKSATKLIINNLIYHYCSCTNPSIYLVLTWSQFKPDMRQTLHVYDTWSDCTKYEIHSVIHVSDITRKQLWQNKHKYITLAQSRSILCSSNLWWLITVPNMIKIDWFIFDISLQIYKIYEIMDINAILTHSLGIFYLHLAPIVVDYCSK